jgi:hypothetical protein
VENGSVKQVPAAKPAGILSQNANTALKSAMKQALGDHAPVPIVNQDYSPDTTKTAEATEPAEFTISARRLALRYLSPSQFFQPLEPTINLQPIVTARTVQQAGNVSPATAMRPVPGDVAPLEQVPSDQYLSPQQTRALLRAQTSENPASAENTAASQNPSTNPVPPSPSPDGAPSGTQASTVAEADKLGSAPESSNLQFLRSEAVLLDPGQWQFDYGLTYSVLDSHFPIALVDGGGDVVGVTDAQVRQRQLIVPLAVRYGCSERLQLFANVPVGWASTEVAYSGIEDESNVGGLGDIDAGASVLIKRASEPYSADIVATISFTSPTGITSLPASILEPSDDMGEGYWGLSESLLFIHTIDPVVLFYGVGYRHRFYADFGRTRVNPGEEINYQFGAGFAVNPWITLSGAVIGAHLTSIELNNTDIEGSGQDPMRLRLSVTAVKGRHIIEPFAEVQMTEDTPSRVGVVFTY